MKLFKKEMKRTASVVLAAAMSVTMLPIGSTDAWGVTEDSVTVYKKATPSDATPSNADKGDWGNSLKAQKDDSEVTVIKINVKGGLKKGENYDGISVLEDMNPNGESGTIDGTVYKAGDGVSGKNNPSPGKGAVPTSGAAVKFEAADSGEISFDINLNANKTWYFVDSSQGVIGSYKNESGNKEARRFTYPIQKGHTYYAYGDGTKSTFFGITIAYGGSMTVDNIYPDVDPKYDSAEGSYEVTELMVPTLAYDEDSIVVVWQKPERYGDVADYHVYINGELQEDTARENYQVYADWSAAYTEAFYDKYEDAAQVDVHSYTAVGLEPETEYTFEVIPVDENGDELAELGSGETITQKTTAEPEIFDIRDYGAKPVEEGFVTYDDEKNDFIEANTRAIQAAIDNCSEGGKVVVPEGIWMTGALWLKSNMTLELQDGAILWSSPNSDHFDVGFLMYPFYTDTRCWGVLNATSSDESQPLENIRITGNGTVYGNGWKYGTSDDIKGDGYDRYIYNYAEKQYTANPVDQDTYGLPRWVAGNNTKVYNLGILAADCAKKYLANVTDENGDPKYADLTEDDYKSADAMKKKVASTDLTNAYATRSSLIMMRNVENVYISGIKVENPANHSVNILDSRNIAANNVKVFSYDCNNGDGLGFGCSQNVICFNNFLDTGDDTIGFGASVGKGAADSEIQSNSNIWIFGNYVHEGHGGIIACGSHTAQGVFNMLAEDNIANYSDMPFRFKSAPANGGYASNVLIRDCAIANCDQAFVFTTSYSDPNSASSSEGADVPAEFYDIDVYNVTADTVDDNTIMVYADVDPVSNPQKPWHTHHNLYFQDVTFDNVSNAGSLTGCENSVFYDVTVNSFKGGSKAEWSDIKYCSGLQFVYSDQDEADEKLTILMNNQMEGPSWSDTQVKGESKTKEEDGYTTAVVDLSWEKANDNAFTVTYGVDTYVGDTMVDTKAGLSDTSYQATGLSTATDYTFKVYAYDPTGNKTLGGEVSVTTAGKPDTTPIATPSDAAVKLSNAFYRHCQGTWDSAKVDDSRVRGYRIYANGELLKTVYNYQIKNGNTVDDISLQIGRLEPGMENQVQIVAFTDAGLEYEYPAATVETLGNYDYKSPQWPAGSQLAYTVNEDGSITLTWPDAEDDTEIYAYRVYVDGEGVYRKDGEYFKPVNETYTTKENSYTVSGLDLERQHTFKVEAGDQWWKSAQTMGTYKQMADHHWSLTGPEAVYTPQDVDKTVLLDLIEQAEGLKDADYTPESWAALNEALKTAKETAANADADQVAVNTAADALQSAIDRLVKADEEEEKADKTELLQAIQDAAELTESDYTEDSWNVFADALEAAMTVSENEDASQEEVTAALEALKEAWDGLIRKQTDSSDSSDRPYTGRGVSRSNVTGSPWSSQNGKWTYTENGQMITGQWAELEWNGAKSWYYFGDDGVMQTGWLQWNGAWFFLHDTADGTGGAMYTGWHEINGKWYYFSDVSDGMRGKLLTNTTTPDGYQVDVNGAWIQ